MSDLASLLENVKNAEGADRDIIDTQAWADAVRTQPPIPSKRGGAVPVAWILPQRLDATFQFTAYRVRGVAEAQSGGIKAIPLYASPQPEAYGVRVTDAAGKAAEQAWYECSGFMSTTDRIRATLEAALSHTEQGEKP